MKRIFVIIITLTISWTVFFISGSEAFASGLVETKPTPTSPVVNPSKSSESLSKQADDLIVGGLDGLKMVSQAALEYYFNVLLTDHYGVSVDGYPSIRFDEDYYYTYSDYVTSTAKPIRAVSSDGRNLNCFNPDYLYDYYVILCVDDDKCDYDSSGFWSSYILEHGNSLSALMNKLHKTGLCPSMALSVLTPHSGSYDFETFSNYYNSLYAKYLSSHGQSSVSVGYETYNSNDYINDFRIPSSSFATAINNNTTSLATSIPTTLVSWKHNPLAVSGYDKIRTVNHFAMMVEGKWFNQSKDLYAMPYVNMNGVTYYGDSVYHMHYGDFEFKYNPSSSTGVVSTKTVKDYPVIDKYSSLSISSEISDTFYPMVSTDSIYDKSWDNVYIVPNGIDMGLESYLAGNKEFYISGLKSTSPQTLYNYRLDPDTNYISGSYIRLFNNVYSASNSANNSPFSDFPNFSNGMTAHDSDYSVETADGEKSLSVDDVPYDYGFLICNKRFEIGALSEYLKPDQIPSNSYVTISGDTVYDYSITNGDTGDTSNFGDFINNGYAWLNTGSGNQTNNGGGTGGNGGGGNVTVGGDVNVSGSVDVNVSGGLDINVNVNGGGNGGGGNSNSYDFDTDPMDDVLSDALEESGGIRQFMKTFFGFLPAKVLSLLMLLITAVIIKVIISKR